ncbi:MAG: sigma-70 family RNA polymerase sigma factor [Elusimicrobia bacterium]|nr:sigma-70 family RNA polymerase sigma factor [Elusimicrobiota bacterium]
MTEEEMVQRYGRMVYNLALRLTGDRDEAADLAQDALVRALRGWRGFRGEADPGSWVYRITLNCWKNSLRSFKKWKVLRFFAPEDSEEVLSEPRDIPGPDPSPEQEAQAAETRRAIAKAMSGLTPEERAVLVLRELDGRSYPEIAASLGIPLGTVKSRLARARMLLAEALSAEEEPHAP